MLRNKYKLTYVDFMNYLQHTKYFKTWLGMKMYVAFWKLTFLTYHVEKL